MTGEVLKISKITVIYGIVVSLYGAIINDVGAFAATGAYAGELAYVGAFFYAGAVALIIGIRAKEWKELKLIFIFWFVLNVLAVVGTIMYIAIIPVDTTVVDFVIYGISIALLGTCIFKQQKGA